MTDHNDKFDDLVDRLLENRASLEPVDLDRIKLQTLGRGTSYSFSSGEVRRRVLAPVLAVGLMTGGTAATLAGGGSHKSSKPPATCGQYKTNGKPKSCKSQKPPKSNKPPKCKSNKPNPPDCKPKTHH